MKPNIVYIHSHDTGRSIHPFGANVDTPNLQRLAEQGLLFRQAFAAAPTCSPSRACLLTGQAAHSNGMLGLAHMGWALNNYHQHLIHTLHNVGYQSALCGIQHIAAKPASETPAIGYHQILSPASRESVDIGLEAANFIHRKHDLPFFLSVGFWDTHRPFPEAEDNPNYTAVLPTLPDAPKTREDMAAFKTSARNLDAGIGRVLNALDETGLSENTLVICTTDHGLPMPKMKCKLTDHGMGVFLIIRGPSGFSGGKVCDAMVSQIDIFPTLCELLAIPAPEWLQGKSIMPLVRGEAAEINNEIYGEVTWHAAYEPKRAVRTKRWKYIRRFDRDYQQEVLPNCDESPAKSLLLDESDWGSSEPAEEQLYDLLLDPQEANNLANVPTFGKMRDEMRERLRLWMERTDDPLLQGEVGLPEFGAAWPQDAPGPVGEPQGKTTQ